MKRSYVFRFFTVFMLTIGMLCPAFAQRKVTIKLASMAPENSPWGAALNRMAREWAQATGGEVEMVVYHSGVVGSEADALRKLKGNQIQAAVFTSFGLNQITPEIITLSCPFLIRDEKELDRVLDRVKPQLEELINGKGFYTLAWSKIGWVRIFSRYPVFVPKDLKAQKEATAEETPALTDAFKAMGYQMVPVTQNELLVALNSHRVDAIYQSPVAVAAYQYFGILKNMASINLAPFMGGIVLNRRGWNSIPDRYKERLTQISRRIAAEIDRSVMVLEVEAVNTMLRLGLTQNTVTPEQAQLWYEDMEKAIPELLDKRVFDRAVFDQIQSVLRDYRGQE